MTTFCCDPNAFVSKAKDMGFEVGLAYDIDTQVSKVPNETDLILLMGRKAGFDRAEFNSKVLAKIDNNHIYAIDGGIDIDNIELIEKEGFGLFTGSLI
jgi:pentose-5-phosphate-3-epimerase